MANWYRKILKQTYYDIDFQPVTALKKWYNKISYQQMISWSVYQTL